MKKILLIIFSILAFTQIKAQNLEGRAINTSIGFIANIPSKSSDNDYEINAYGFHLQGEYVLPLAEWVNIRPYLGFILTWPNDYEETPSEYKSTMNAVLFGGKARFILGRESEDIVLGMAIYIELGVGASYGSFKTVTPAANIDMSGVIMHIPIAFGFVIGPEDNIDISIGSYFHPSVEQFAFDLGLGISFPIGK